MDMAEAVAIMNSKGPNIGVFTSNVTFASRMPRTAILASFASVTESPRELVYSEAWRA